MLVAFKRALFSPRHPIDKALGIETSSYVRRSKLRTGNASLDANNVGYVGSQPSVIRAALDRIPNSYPSAFVDIGCGKGRALAVATEYPYDRVIGFEIVPSLAQKARANALKLGNSNICVKEEDALDSGNWDDVNLTLFLYNSFRAPLVKKFITAMEEWAARNTALALYLVYYNPAHFELFDQSPVLERYHADRVAFDANEPRFASNDADSFVIYRAKRVWQAAPMATADRKVVVTIPDLGADVMA